MLSTYFGVEVEFTGITRSHAATILKSIVPGCMTHEDAYDARIIIARDGRKWKIVSDSSVTPQRKVGTTTFGASEQYKCEFVTPILKYAEDIDTLQEIIRAFRKAGAIVNHRCGIHIHLDGAGHDARTIKNWIKIIASKDDLLYKALAIHPERRHYCQALSEKLIRAIDARKPKTLKEVEDIWYDGYYGSRFRHYHDSRYQFLNLHSFFNGHGTVELRGFNSTMHAGKLRSYIVLALALNKQALCQRNANSRKVQTENDKFAMRTYLNRIGLIGDEFKNCRKHLTDNLTGCAAWRFGRTA